MGPWRIVDLRGLGTYGAVYLAQGVAPEAPGPVALKLALHARDARFAREVELLSRLQHPGVPRLLDSGQWHSPARQPHPYLAMQWLEGLPLYEWARFRSSSSRQVLRLLAGLARALEATHAAGGVHRDVKGDNALVRLSDGQVFLIDFGSSHYRGASALTEPVFPPGTPAYRSPEAFRFALNIRQAPVKTYAPGPAEDVFALGVTGYRLVTGQYPPTADPLDKEVHVWAPDGTGPRPARALNASCCVELSALISRMLSLRPEARGSAHELAEALEQAAREAGPEADAPLFFRQAPAPVDVEPEADAPLSPRNAPRPVDVEAAPQHASLRAPRRSWRPWLTAAGLAGPVALGAAWLLSLPSRENSAQVRVAEQAEERDAGTVAVGDSVLTAPAAPTRAPSAWSAIAVDLPSNPLPGQVRPDANGRCPYKTWVPIHGGCWAKVDPKDCEESSYVYKGACYLPAYPPPRPATSDPVESRDGG